MRGSGSALCGTRESRTTTRRPQRAPGGSRLRSVVVGAPLGVAPALRPLSGEGCGDDGGVAEAVADLVDRPRGAGPAGRLELVERELVGGVAGKLGDAQSEEPNAGRRVDGGEQAPGDAH